MKNATLIGLIVAIFGPMLLAGPFAKLFANPNAFKIKILGQLSMWLLFAAILSVILFWEKLPLSSIGYGPLSWKSVAFGAGLSLLQYGLSTIWLPIMAKLGLGEFGSGLQKVNALPLWYLIFAVVTAGFVEETLYRGYGIERVAALTHNYWAAACMMAVIFGLVHTPTWGLGPSVGLIVLVIPGSIYYVLTRDLWALIILHIVTDSIGLILIPKFVRQ